MKKPVVKKSCLSCFYWTGKVGIGRAYKCYCGSCPAKARDEKLLPEKPANKHKLSLQKRNAK